MSTNINVWIWKVVENRKSHKRWKNYVLDWINVQIIFTFFSTTFCIVSNDWKISESLSSKLKLFFHPWIHLRQSKMWTILEIFLGTHFVHSAKLMVKIVESKASFHIGNKISWLLESHWCFLTLKAKYEQFLKYLGHLTTDD